MPSRSEAQRRYLNSRFGHGWVKDHHFDNKGDLPEHVSKEIPTWANYRKASDATESCGTCNYFKGGVCTMFDNYPVEREYTCDEWEGVVEKDTDPKYTADPVDRSFEGEDTMRMAMLSEGLEPDQLSKSGGIKKIPRDALVELERFWAAHPGVRAGCKGKYGHDPVEEAESYWPYGIAEPEHADVLRAIEENGGVFSLPLVLLWESEELSEVSKAAGTLYLVSHAKTRYNNSGKQDIVNGWRDTPLSSEGRKQATQLGKSLRGKGIEKVYASDLKRGTATGEAIARAAGVPLKVSGDYRPWDLGEFVGHSTVDVIPKLKPYLIDHPDKPVAGGESFDSFKDRFIPALEKILSEVEKGHTVVLVTHSRNLELTQGWLGGRGPRKKIDTNAISVDDVPPGMVMVVTPQQGKHWKMKVEKGQANPCEVCLRVHGVTRHPTGQLVYRMDTRDGHYVGRTNPTNHRARKGDILKVQVNDLSIDSNGDARWVNANVIGHHDDTAHSWKDLNALADGQFVKDGSGPTGESVPAAGDQGNPGMPTPGALAASGPTIGSVHVNRPLKNISVAYMNRVKRFEVKKADSHKQIVYGVVLEPNVLDTQDDFMLADQVEKAAHKYLEKVVRGQATVSKLQHRKVGFFKHRASVVPVESFIAPCDFSYDGKETVSKGTWVMAFHVEDANIWKQVLSGEYTGFSIGGTGIRQEATVPPLEQFNTNPSSW